MDKIGIGAYIASLRKLRGKTQKDLAGALNYTPQAISKIERGEGFLPFDSFVDLCAYLDCSLDSFYERAENPAPFDPARDRIDFGKLGEQLTKARESLGCSQQQWAEKLGISPKSLRNYEKGLRIPPYFVFEGYCEHASVLPSVILRKEEAVAPTPKRRFNMGIIIGTSSLVVVGLALGISGCVGMSSHTSKESESSAVIEGSEPAHSIESDDNSGVISSIESDSPLSSEGTELTSEGNDSISSESSEESLSEADSSSAEIPKVYIEPRSDGDDTVALTLPSEYKTYGMGSFPQEAVTDPDLASVLSALEGGLTPGKTVEYQGERYLVDDCLASFKSSGGDVVPAGICYFRYSPIRWLHCADDQNGHLLISENVLFARPFADSPVYRLEQGVECEVWNNYEHSSIRDYLNHDFYGGVFSPEEKERILLTHVDNSLGTTIDNHNNNLSNDTDDYVYLPSCKEVNLGGSDKRFRKSAASDYFKAKGGRYETSVGDPGEGNGFYWLRSPYPESTQTAYERVCDDIGMIYATYDHDSVPMNASFIDDDDLSPENGPYGIRPVIRLGALPID